MTNKENIYRVYESDDYGRPNRTLGYIKASSTKEAREEMSIKLYGTKDTELVKTGYYGAYPIPVEEYRANYEKARKELAKFDRNLL
jgi:hypothetical protein